MEKLVVFGVIKSLHDLFTALWVGGILTTAISLMPAIRKSGVKPMPAALGALNERYQRRLRIFALVSIIGLWITGILLGRQSAGFTGLFRFTTPYEMMISIKHLLIFVMVTVAVVRGFVLGGQFDTFSPSKKKLSAGLLMFNSVLGIAVIFLSGFSAALG